MQQKLIRPWCPWWLVLPVLVAWPGTAIPAEPEPFTVQAVKDVAYYNGADADPVRHKLDLYVPKGHKDFPVLFFLHGGAWIKGSKNEFGVYGLLANCLVRQGIGVVCPNYRLSPSVKHPEHIRDVARAFAWTHRNIPRYGGRPSELFVGGHSAGGHLASLLATNDSYLKGEGLNRQAIRGVLPISGVYRIPQDRFFTWAFGDDSQLLRSASPYHQIGKNLPPFLLLYADRDIPYCDGDEAQTFCRALQAQQVPAETLCISNRSHMTILFKAITDGDPAAQALASFIMTQVLFDRLEEEGAGIDVFQDFLVRFLAARK